MIVYLIQAFNQVRGSRRAAKRGNNRLKKNKETWEREKTNQTNTKTPKNPHTLIVALTSQLRKHLASMCPNPCLLKANISSDAWLQMTAALHEEEWIPAAPHHSSLLTQPHRQPRASIHCDIWAPIIYHCIKSPRADLAALFSRTEPIYEALKCFLKQSYEDSSNNYKNLTTLKDNLWWLLVRTSCSHSCARGPFEASRWIRILNAS